MGKVFISGTFDLLHSGHLAFIEEASKHGDLYVGVSSDKTIETVRGYKPVNSQDERLQLVKSLKYVTEAWINSGSGVLDFAEEVLKLNPDLFFIRSDSYTKDKEAFCKNNNLKYIVAEASYQKQENLCSDSIIHNCGIPYKINLAGAWMDQHFVNKVYPGSVITISVDPDPRFDSNLSLSTNTRNKAIDLWGPTIPLENKERLAKQLFCYENEPMPNKKYVFGSQNAIGLVFPGINKLNYSNSYWPYRIDSILKEEIISWLESVLWLVPLGSTPTFDNIYDNMNIIPRYITRLSNAANDAWNAIGSMNIEDFGTCVLNSFKAQLKMFPRMVNDFIWKKIEDSISKAYGYKLANCCGESYLILVSDSSIENGFQVKIRRG